MASFLSRQVHYPTWKVTVHRRVPDAEKLMKWEWVGASLQLDTAIEDALDHLGLSGEESGEFQITVTST